MNLFLEIIFSPAAVAVLVILTMHLAESVTGD